MAAKYPAKGKKKKKNQNEIRNNSCNTCLLSEAGREGCLIKTSFQSGLVRRKRR